MVSDSYERWKELEYSVRGGTMVSHDNFLITNKYRSKLKNVRVLKEKEIRFYGEYRTKRLVLEAWQELNKKNK